MDKVVARKLGRNIKFTLRGKVAIVTESKDLFGCNIVTLVIDGEYIGAFDVYTIDQVHEYLLKDNNFIAEAYC